MAAIDLQLSHDFDEEDKERDQDDYGGCSLMEEVNEGNATTTTVCRVGIHEELTKRRSALTDHEFSFAQRMIREGKDADVQALDKTLRDQDLFFAPPGGFCAEVDLYASTPCLPTVASDDRYHMPTVASLPLSPSGSIKRQSRIELRKSCHTQAELWKQASQNILGDHDGEDFDPSQRQLRPSIRSSIRSNASSGSPRRSSITAGSSISSPQRSTAAGSPRRSISAMSPPQLATSIEHKETTSWNSLEQLLQKSSTNGGLGLPILLSSKETKEDDEDENDSTGAPANTRQQLLEPPLPPRHNLMTRKASMNIYHGQGFEVGEEEMFDTYSKRPQHYDPWDEETDRTGHLFDFHILGTSHYDTSVLPHVLSPPLMHALQGSLPYAQRGESFWLKYSMVRDGASLTTLLRQVRASTNTLLAMETIDGEVFGAFCSNPWTVQPKMYGHGPHSFVWRMKHSRMEMASSVWEQAKRETDLEIFSCNTTSSSNESLVQLCNTNRLCVGTGTPLGPHTVQTGETYSPNEFGFAIALGESLLEASSNACLSFDSPPLVNRGLPVELIKLEVWALTPFLSEEEARHMEYHRLFLKRNATFHKSE